MSFGSSRTAIGRTVGEGALLRGLFTRFFVDPKKREGAHEGAPFIRYC